MHTTEPEVFVYALIGALALAGVGFVGMWAAVKWVKKQIVEIITDFVGSEKFVERVATLRAKEMRSEVTVAVEEHNECEDAHPAALRPYITREEVLLRLTNLETELAGFKEVTLQRFGTLETGVHALALDIRNGGIKPAGGGTVVPRN